MCIHNNGYTDSPMSKIAKEEASAGRTGVDPHGKPNWRGG